MMNGSYGLGFVFTAHDLASAKIENLERSFLSLSDRVGLETGALKGSFRELGVGFGVLAGGAALLGGAFLMANAAGHFEQKIAAIGAVTKATASQLDALRDAAIDAGIRTQFSPEEASAGLLTLATAGQTAKESIQTLVPVLDLAAGALGEVTVDKAADAVVGTLNAYGMAADRAAIVTDKLLKVTLGTNFQARDFEAGLAKAAATGSMFGESLDDVLITMGLLRNRNIDASSSATAYREALRRLGSETRAQQAVQGAGVDVFDRTTGKLRPMLDVMDDFSLKTAGMTDAEKNRRIVTAFGARGLMAFNAVMNARVTLERDGVETTYEGAAAVRELRTEMQNAAGTATFFRERLLDTFEGQKTLLRGTLKTYAIVLGAPFEQVFKPILKVVVGALNAVLEVLRAAPAGLKRTFAWIFVGAGAFLSLVGGALAAKAAFALAATGMKVLGISLGGVVAAVLPAVFAVALLGAALAGFKMAVDRNVGGIGDRFRAIGRDVSLFFRGAAQLIEEGGFSGAVLDELARIENAGLKRFLIGLYQVAYRILRIGEGIRTGFLMGLYEAGPVFDDLSAALLTLGEQLGEIYRTVTGSAAALPSERYRAFGQIVGEALSGMVTVATRAVAVVARVLGGMVSGWRQTLGWLEPAFGGVRLAVAHLAEAWDTLSGSNANAIGVVDASTSTWFELGRVIGQVVGGAITFVTLVLAGLLEIVSWGIAAVGALRTFFVALGETVSDISQGIVEFFTNTIPGAIDALVASLRRMVQEVLRPLPDELLPQALVSLKATTTAVPATPTASVSTAMPAVVEARSRAVAAAQAAQAPPRGPSSAPPPFVVQLQVDGETLARVAHDGAQKNALRSFTPVASY